LSGVSFFEGNIGLLFIRVWWTCWLFFVGGCVVVGLTPLSALTGVTVDGVEDLAASIKFSMSSTEADMMG